MSSVLYEHQDADFSESVSDLFLGVCENDGRVVVNIYLQGQVAEARLLDLLVSFTYDGEEVMFEVEKLQRGIPMRLFLKPKTNREVVEEFIRNVISVCVVPTVTFHDNGATCVVRNSRYNDFHEKYN